VDLSVDMYYLECMEYQHEQHTVHLIVYHLIWCPKRRRHILVDKIASRLEQIIREVSAEHDLQVHELAIQTDRVHLFLRANPYTLLMDIARLIKGRSSHELREEFPSHKKMPFLWIGSIFYSTAGNISSDIVQHYIERQSKA
jgi:REP-associated tyrosine transposase